MKYSSNRKPTLTAISLFSGAMGLDLGFELSGFQIRIASEMRKEACDTIRLNRPDVPLLTGDIAQHSTTEILKVAKLQVGEPTVVIGGPPCQSFSTAGTRKSFNEKRGIALLEFVRVLKESRPRFFVFENVKGLTNASLKHISFYQRIKMKDHEIPDESKLGTAFKYVLDKLSETGYSLSYRILNSADYGSPQKRLRLIIIGSRDEEEIGFPDPTHDLPNSISVTSGKRKPWRVLRDVLNSLKEDEQEYVKFPSWGKYVKYIKPGGDWRDLPLDVQREAMKGSFFSQGGRTGYFRRLSLDLTCPTLVTSPVFKGTCLAHPIFNRPLSVQEYAAIQGFSRDWKFVGSTMKKYRMIGEAVPIELGYAIASHMRIKVNGLINLEYSIRRERS